MRPKRPKRPSGAAGQSASVYDNQVRVPLARLSAQRVMSLYTLMDAAYDNRPLRQFERELGSCADCGVQLARAFER